LWFIYLLLGFRLFENVSPSTFSRDVLCRRHEDAALDGIYSVLRQGGPVHVHQPGDPLQGQRDFLTGPRILEAAAEFRKSVLIREVHFFRSLPKGKFQGIGSANRIPGGTHSDPAHLPFGQRRLASALVGLQQFVFKFPQVGSPSAQCACVSD
jgi:hypothetical protein